MDANPFEAPVTELDSSGFAPAGAEAAAPFFAVGVPKLVLMGLATFSFYNLYWFYRQFKRARERRGDGTSPFWRAVFAVFFCYELFQSVSITAHGEDLPEPFRPGRVAAAFIVVSLMAYLPSPGWLLGFGGLIPLAIVQRSINTIHAKVAPEAERNERFSAVNWLALVFGGLFWLLVIAGLFMTPEASA